MLSGNLGSRRHARFMPGEFKYQETKAPPLKDAYDEFLARVICFVFSVSPEPFVGQVNRATAQSSHARAIDEGLAPLMRYLRALMNRIIATEFASPDLEFAWEETRAQDPGQAAQIDVAYVGAGILTVDEVRANLGLLPLEKLPKAQAAQKKTSAMELRKDDDDDDDAETDDDGSSSNSSDSDDDGGSGNFDAKHPRWAGGSPGGIGGQFAPKDSGSATTTLHGAMAQDAAGNTQVAQLYQIPPAIGILGEISRVGEGGAAEIIKPGIAETETLQPVAPAEEVVPAEEVTGEKVSVPDPNEISRLIDKAIKTKGNDGDITSTKSDAEKAAEEFVGSDARPINNREGNPVGKISADGTRAARYTSA